MRHVALLAPLLYLTLSPSVRSDSKMEQIEHEEYKLHMDLLSAYNSDIRPVVDHNSGVTVKVRLALKYLTFDALEETVTVHSWITLNWHDPFLTWTPSDYDDINEIQVQSHEIWNPGLDLFNADTTTYTMILGDSIYTSCRLTNTGKVTCVPHLAHTAICQTSLTRWPYDVQNCTLHFGAWMYNGGQVNFTFYDTRPVVLDEFHNGAGWKLLNVTYDRLANKYSLNGIYPMLKYTFMLRREAAGLAAIVVAPSIVLVLVTLASLLLDVKDTRLVLLCFSLFGHFMMISEIAYVVPKMSADTPIILLFIRDSLIITLIAIIQTMVLMSLGRQAVPAPAWIIFLNRLISIGPGKYLLVFTEFDRSVAARGKTVTADSGDNNARTSSEWIKFASVLNILTIVVFLLVYLVLLCIYIPRDK